MDRNPTKKVVGNDDILPKIQGMIGNIKSNSETAKAQSKAQREGTALSPHELGFRPEGVKKDTPAAEAQSSQKNVEPGSDFAVYQGRQMKR